MNAKLGKNTTQRNALVRGQASELLWHGKIETTAARAASVQAYVEPLITLAIKTYQDNVKITKETKNAKGVKIKKEVTNDGAKKLAARRKMMAKLYDMQEERAKGERGSEFKARTKKINHPIIEKLFNFYAPHFEKRAKELGTNGGYTRVIRKDIRRGDNAEIVVLSLLI